MQVTEEKSFLETIFSLRFVRNSEMISAFAPCETPILSLEILLSDWKMRPWGYLQRGFQNT